MFEKEVNSNQILIVKDRERESVCVHVWKELKINNLISLSYIVFFIIFTGLKASKKEKK